MVQCTRAHISELIVKKNFRKKGIGKQLLDHATSWCKKMGATQLILTLWDGNVDARKFYKKQGYTIANTCWAKNI